MLSITLRNMRTGWVRLIAAGLAIMLGTGFVTASMLGGNVMQEATYQSFTRDYRGYDGLITPGGGSELTPEVTAKVESTPGVERIENKAKIASFIEHSSHPQWAIMGPVEDSSTDRLTAGALPSHDGEAALSEHYATVLGLGIGDSFTTSIIDGRSDSTEDAVTYTISGLLKVSPDFFSKDTHILITPEDFNSERFAAVTAPGPLAFAIADGADLNAVAGELRTMLGDEFSVTSVAEFADGMMEHLTGEVDTMRNVILGFAAIALVVAILVISNTFSVLVAQRTRHLALLRTVGASRTQIRLSVLAEALGLGLIASIGGVLLGLGIIAGAVAWLGSAMPGLDLWAGVKLTPAVWLTTVITGLVITLLAGWEPARAATKVRPLEALHPRDPALGTTAGKFRATLAALAFVGGVGLLVTALLLRSDPSFGPAIGLAVGIAGGFISVIGIMLGAVFLISSLVRVVGRIFGRGVPATVATMGAIRNPRRTATTTTALFIGVALVAMMSTGAVTAKKTLDNKLSEIFYSDMQAVAMTNPAGERPPISTEQITALQGHESVAMVTTFARTEMFIGDTESGIMTPLEVTRAGAEVPIDSSVRTGVPLADLQIGEAIISSYVSAITGLKAGDSLSGSVLSGEDANLTIRAVADSLPGIIVNRDTFLTLAPDAGPRHLIIEFTPGADPVPATTDIEELLAATPGAYVQTYSGAVEREGYTGAIDMLLLIVSALLAVAVVISLVGVANTLSLSVIERRRESATLRALGLTTGQLRTSLAIEGTLIALLGAIVGVVAGLAYGWSGAYVVLQGMADVVIAVPWGTIAAVFIVAVAAGMLASVIPARSAVRIAPVAALAE